MFFFIAPALRLVCFGLLFVGGFTTSALAAPAQSSHAASTMVDEGGREGVGSQRQERRDARAARRAARQEDSCVRVGLLRLPLVLPFTQR